MDVKDSQGRSGAHVGAEHGNIACLELLVAFSNINDVDSKGNTMLHLASSARVANVDVVSFILSKGVDRSVRNREGKTALMCCVDSRVRDLIETSEEKRSRLEREKQEADRLAVSIKTDGHKVSKYFSVVIIIYFLFLI